MVNSFLEDHMTDMQGWGTGRPSDKSYLDRRPLVVGCQHLGRRARTALTSEGFAC
jgi:hypothetical protein